MKITVEIPDGEYCEFPFGEKLCLLLGDHGECNLYRDFLDEDGYCEIVYDGADIYLGRRKCPKCREVNK